MKNRTLARLARRCGLSCLLLLALTASASAQKLKINPSNPGKNEERVAATTEVGPEVVKGLEAAAAAKGKTKGKVVKAGDRGAGNTLMLFGEAENVTRDDAARGFEAGVIYVASSSTALPAGCYAVNLRQQAAGQERPGLGITLVDEGGACLATGPRAGGALGGPGGPLEKRMHKPLVITKPLSAPNFITRGGVAVLDTTSLGGDILAAVNEFLNTSKDNTKDR